MHKIGTDEIQAVQQVLESGQFMRYRGGEGGYVEQFEAALCAKIGVRHALTVTSGTAALSCALVGLGVGPGDEVIIPAYTWIATALAALSIGAVPVLANIDASLMLDPEDVQRKISPFTKVIMPVHMKNCPCAMDELMAVAKAHGLYVVEDACQAVGASYKGRRLGSIGHAGAFSFNQFKNITCGEGGAVLTNDQRLHNRATIYHDVGSYTRSNSADMKIPFFPGVNFRVSEIQGAILGPQLKRLDGFLAGLHQRYNAMAEILRESNRFRLTPHNDAASALTVTLLFDTEQQAVEFATEFKVHRIIDSGLHVYKNWQPLMEQRCHHPRLNPFAWAHRRIDYTPEMCQRSLDIMARTCWINYAYDAPLDELRAQAKAMVQSVASTTVLVGA